MRETLAQHFGEIADKGKHQLLPDAGRGNVIWVF
jgi:hypothetical protein